MRADKNYEQALIEISRLRPAVDTFFDNVMVMVDDPQLRANNIIVPLEGAGGKLTSTVSSPMQIHGVAKEPARRVGVEAISAVSVRWPLRAETNLTRGRERRSTCVVHDFSGHGELIHPASPRVLHTRDRGTVSFSESSTESDPAAARRRVK